MWPTTTHRSSSPSPSTRTSLRLADSRRRAEPTPRAATNLTAAHAFLATQAARFGLPMSRFERVRDLFATDNPQGGFALWCSMVFRSGRRPEFKVYFNPEVKGVDAAPGLVAEALTRLGLAASYQARSARRTPRRTRPPRPADVLRPGPARRAARPGQALPDPPRRRSHATLARAAAVVDEIDAAEVSRVLRDRRRRAGAFDGRPLVSSYTFTRRRRPADRLQRLRPHPQLRRRRSQRPATGCASC